MNKHKYSDISAPYIIDEMRLEEKKIISTNQDLLEAVKKYKGDLDDVKYNKNNKAKLGEYTHTLLFPDPKVISKRFKLVRTTIGLTQKQMGFLTGMTQQSVYKIETGKAFPSAIWVMNMMTYFDVNPHWFISGESTMFTSRSMLEEHFQKLTQKNEKLKKELERKDKIIDKLLK
nr:putative phage repressor protein CI [uncultured Mediterranean phage uvMED]